MKSINGFPSKVNNEVLGIITTNRFCLGTDRILYTSQDIIAELKFKAVISHIDLTTKLPFIRLSQPDKLYEGDVVRIKQDGTVIVLIEAQSNSNAIVISNNCNAHCIMCPQYDNHEEITSNDVMSLISLLPPRMKYVTLTGGEPTLESQLLLSAIRTLKKRQPNAHIEILTNGILLSDVSYVRSIVDIKHPSISFHIPLYSDVSELHDSIMGTQGFYMTLKGLYNLASYKQKIEIRFVINKLTYRRMTNTSEFIFKNLPFAKHVALMGNEYCGLSRDNADKLWIDPLDYQDELESSVLHLNRFSVNVSVYNHQLCTLRPSLWSFAKRSISEWKQEYVESCKFCDYKDECGGFFATSNGFLSRGINPMRRLPE